MGHGCSLVWHGLGNGHEFPHDEEMNNYQQGRTNLAEWTRQAAKRKAQLKALMKRSTGKFPVRRVV